MVFGAFDYLHQGHIDFFNQARQHGDYLIVVVARDQTVKKIKNTHPTFSEKDRLLAVRESLGVDLAILGDSQDYFKNIKKYQPEVICLGYDQVGFSGELPKLFPKIKIVRLKPFYPEIYKSSIIKNKLKK